MLNEHYRFFQALDEASNCFFQDEFAFGTRAFDLAQIGQPLWPNADV
jgi:hypothetical protein